MTVVILGGGPAGLAVAHGLVEGSKSDFVLLDSGPQVGGLAQTVSWDGVGTHDLGPHKIFTLNTELLARVEGLLRADQWLTREKTSAIFMNGHFLPYPPSPFSLAKVFGSKSFAQMILDYGMARTRGLLGRAEPRTFEDDLHGRLGESLYQVLFAPIARKLWGSPTRLDVKLSRGRVQTPKLQEVIARMLKLQRTSEFEALTFRYPGGGLSKLWDAIKQKTANRGRFHLGLKVTRLEVERQRITAVHAQAQDGTTMQVGVGPDDFVVSTIPLAATTRLLKDAVGGEIEQECTRAVTLNDLLLVFLHVDLPSLLPQSWIFVPDPDVAFHRVSEQESFDPSMTPDGSIICCEVMSNELRDMSSHSDEELVSEVRRGLERMGYRGHQVLKHRVIRLPSSYPVYRPGFEYSLTRILSALDCLENFRTIGRQGAFNYIGTLDAMDIGYGFARWFAGGRTAASWIEERTRTSHYPVLD